MKDTYKYGDTLYGTPTGYSGGVHKIEIRDIWLEKSVVGYRTIARVCVDDGIKINMTATDIVRLYETPEEAKRALMRKDKMYG